MPNNSIKYLFLLIAIFSLAACEEVVDLPFDPSPRLEISSDLSDKNGLVATVYYSRSINDQSEVKYVDDATVKVYKGSTFLEELELYRPIDLKTGQQSYPRYRTKNMVPEYEIEYTLVVEVKDFKPIKAKTSVPKPVSMEASFVPQFSDEKEDNVTVDLNVELSLNDPAETTNYYHIRFFQEMLVDYSFLENGDTVSARIDTNQVQFELVNAQSPAERYANNGFLLNDRKFNGQRLTLNFVGKYVYDKTKYLPREFFIEFRTVSEEYYRKHDSINNQDLSEGDNGPISGETGVIYNNTDNGLGSFAGFTSKINSFRLNN